MKLFYLDDNDTTGSAVLSLWFDCVKLKESLRNSRTLWFWLSRKTSLE